MGQVLRAAVPRTVPVLAGYLFLGLAFGLLLSSKGYGWGIALLMSVFIYAGSMQFVAVGLLTAPFDLGTAAVLTLLVNARHLFYGLSMLKRFQDTGKWKPYLVLSLTDETYSLLCHTKVPEGMQKGSFYGAIALLNHLYWIVGSVCGALFGSLLVLNVEGIDFVMTALFIVIFVEQWEQSKDHTAALTGVFVTVLFLLLVGSQWFLLPSMGGILGMLTLLRSRLEVKYHDLAAE
jgi:4-azaleucine resistance transporter AzlC